MCNNCFLICLMKIIKLNRIVSWSIYCLILSPMIFELLLLNKNKRKVLPIDYHENALGLFTKIIFLYFGCIRLKKNIYFYNRFLIDFAFTYLLCDIITNLFSSYQSYIEMKTDIVKKTIYHAYINIVSHCYYIFIFRLKWIL